MVCNTYYLMAFVSQFRFIAILLIKIAILLIFLQRNTDIYDIL